MASIREDLRKKKDSKVQRIRNPPETRKGGRGRRARGRGSRRWGSNRNNAARVFFTLDDSELGCTDVVHHVIDIGDHPPIKQQPYHTPAVHRQKIASTISDMEKQNVPLHSWV